jgi:ubiquitin carboxyl-terminal hydrolase L3
MENSEKVESFEWPPLESDPEIFNKYFHKIGLPENIEFDELWSLDYKEVQEIDGPVIGVICAIRRPKGRYFLQENLTDYNNVPFYMKQEGSLDNACGVVASLHCFGNLFDKMQLNDDSILGSFFNKTKNATPEERCKLLEEDNKFKEVHYHSAQQGQSSMPTQQEKVWFHYIAFVNYNQNLVELDGTLPGPIIIKKNSLPENLLDDTIEELKKRLDEGYIAENLSVIVVKQKI